jgi:hypothetical protein
MVDSSTDLGICTLVVEVRPNLCENLTQIKQKFNVDLLYLIKYGAAFGPVSSLND